MNAWLQAILQRHKVVLAVLLALLASGIASYISIPKEARPDIQVPVFLITVPLPGVSPEDAERLLVRPMEKELRRIAGLKELTSIAGQGNATLLLEFEPEVDVDEAARKVRQKVDLARPELPEDALEPVVNEVNFALFPTMMVVISGHVPQRTLRTHAKRLQRELETLPGVLEARISGAREELLEVIIDEVKMLAYGVTHQDLINAVRGHNQLVAAGSLTAGGGSFTIKVPASFRSWRDVRNLPVKSRGGAVITLADVASIRRTFKERASHAYFNGRPSITIEIVKRVGANIIAVNDAVRDRTRQATKSWPAALHVGFVFDESKRIGEVLVSLQNSVLTAIVLVMVIVVAALGVRSGLLVGLAIPASFLTAFAIMALLGKTMNNMMLFGLVLTVGMLVDAAIVIVEYADRKMAEGLDARAAYMAAAQRMFAPVAASTATTLAAFLPLLFWPGIMGKFMSNLPVTVVIVLSASLLVAMVFLPVVGGYLGRRPKDAVDDVADISGAAVEVRKLKGVTGAYARLLAAMIRRPLLVLIGAALLIGLIIVAYGKFNRGVEFFVAHEPDRAFVYVRARGNLTVAEKNRLVTAVQRRVLAVDGVDDVITLAGSAGNSGIGSGAGVDQPRDAIGRITLTLKPPAERKPGDEVLADIRRAAASVPGVLVEVRKFEEGPPTGKDIRLQVKADTPEKAHAAAARVRRHLEKEVKGLRDIEDENPLPGAEWVLTIDREETGRYGANVPALGAMVQLVTNGVKIGSYRPGGSDDEVEIRVRLPEGERHLGKLDHLRLLTPFGLVPVSNFVHREIRHRVDTITRKDGLYSIYVKANVQKGVDPNLKVREIGQWLKARAWPDGVTFRFRGADEEQRKSAAFLTRAMIAAIFIMFLILLIQFNSVWHVLLTLSTLVLSMAGVLLGMLVFGQKFSVLMSGTGVVALAGIVVNNAIVLIDTYHINLRRGLQPRRAALISAVQRFRPVMLTTITTIFGLVPMIYELNVNWFSREVGIGSIISSWWVQLATTIVSGLAFATLLTLVLTPVLLAAPSVWRDHWRKRPAEGETPPPKKSKKKKAETAEPPATVPDAAQ